MPSPFAACAAVALPCLMLAAAPQQPTWQLRSIAETTGVGGNFRDASFSADSSRMLTVGEEGDVILWDLPEGRERTRFASAGGGVDTCHLHPTDPWAVVIDEEEHTAHRLDFGTGRYQRLWTDRVIRFAFDHGGTRAAVLFEAERGSRLAVYTDAALRSVRTLPPDFTCELRSWSRVLFHPGGAAVYVGDWSESWRIPLDGREPSPGPERLRGFLPDGTPVVDTNQVPCEACAGPHQVSERHGQIVRRGAAPAEWTIEHPSWSCRPSIAADGTVAAPDDRGGLALLGPEVDRRRTLRGHAGPAHGLCFDATNRFLAITGGGALAVLDLTSGACRQRTGTFAVAPAPDGPGFLLLDPATLRRLDPITDTTTGVANVAEDFAPEVFRRYWTGRARSLPFVWQPRARRLWVDRPACIVDGRGSALEQPRQADECPHQDVITIAAGARDDVLFAETTRPIQCGNGLENVRSWSTLRRYDAEGRLRRSRALESHIGWMRVSPRGEKLAIPAADGSVAVFASHDLHPIGTTVIAPDADVVAFEFLDEDDALATDGTRLLHVRLTTGRVRPLDLGQLPGPITRIAVSADRALVAIACNAAVRVLRRR